MASDSLCEELARYLRRSENKPFEPRILLEKVISESKLHLWQEANIWHADVIGCLLAVSTGHASFAGNRSREWLEHQWSQAFLETPPEYDLPMDIYAAYGFVHTLEIQRETGIRQANAIVALVKILETDHPIPDAGVL